MKEIDEITDKGNRDKNSKKLEKKIRLKKI